MLSESVKMFDEGWALDFKVFHLSLPETFLICYTLTADGVEGDTPTFASQRRVIVPSLDSTLFLFFPPQTGDVWS